TAMNVGEVASSPAGDQDLLSHAIGMVEQDYAPPSAPGLDGAHQPRRPAAQHHHIHLLHTHSRRPLQSRITRVPLSGKFKSLYNAEHDYFSIRRTICERFIGNERSSQ